MLPDQASAAEGADVLRDTLAIIAAVIARDADGLDAIADNCEQPKVIGMLAGLLLLEIERHGSDPHEWIARHQHAARYVLE